MSIVSIEGNIGVGKSTFLSNLPQNGFVKIKEPLDIWDRIRDNDSKKSMLELYYGDPHRYGFPFQMMALISRSQESIDTVERNPSKIIISERSLNTDKFVFAKMLHDDGKIEDVNHQIYTLFFDGFEKKCHPKKIIRLRGHPSICKQRIVTRGRKGEEDIPLEYLEQYQKYEDHMFDVELPKLGYTDKDILTFDANIDITQNPSIVKQWIDKAVEFIHSP